MRFRATFRMLQQPSLYGGTLKKLPSCHEFSVSGVKIDYSKVKYNSIDEAEVSLVAGKYSADSSLHGPASLIKNRTIIYPCESFRCRVPCPCYLCRKASCICEKAPQNNTCGECAECRFDCEDHLVFHRAPHLNCKFCLNALDHLPHMQLVIREVKGHYPDWYEVRTSASVFRHVLQDIEAKKDGFSKFGCDKCCKKFTKIGDLKKHEISIHFGAKHECEYCDYKFSRHDNLKDHIKLIHMDDCFQHACDLCGKSFTRKSDLVRHSKVTQACEICLIEFCSLKQLHLHKKIDHPKFLCDHCQKSFQDSAKLKRHTSSKLNANGDWKNYCEICEIGFCSFIDLARHNKRHPKECKFCGKRFITNRKLRDHLTKREEKLCSTCGKMMCNETNLRVHVKSSHNVKQCKVCSKIYSIENIKHHMYSVHQQIFDENE